MKTKWSDAWQMLSASQKINFIMTALVIAAMWLFVAYAISTAHASPSCMTYKEARAKYKRAHLYWNTDDRCWDRRHWTYAKKKRHRIGYAMATPTTHEPKPKPEIKDECCWPKLPRDEAGQIIEPPPTFGERWEQVRDAFRSVWERIKP